MESDPVITLLVTRVVVVSVNVVFVKTSVNTPGSSGAGGNSASSVSFGFNVPSFSILTTTEDPPFDPLLLGGCFDCILVDEVLDTQLLEGKLAP